MKEFDLIQNLIAPLVRFDGADGLTDDVSLLPRFDGAAVITTDTLVENVHFRSADPLYSVGQKLVRVNVSDCLAKGAKPKFALLNLTLPNSMSDQQIRDIMGGVSADLTYFEMSLIGGDTTSSPTDLVVSLTVIGECAEGAPVRRSGACVGDDIWVTGTIGDSGLGLRLPPAEVSVFPDLLQAYLVPSVPDSQIAECISLYANSSVDVSDGLVADLTHIVECSGVRAQISLSDIPVSDAADRYLDRSEATLRKEDLLGFGDDYQCLFTAPQSVRPVILSWASENAIRLSRIGKVLEGQGVSLLGADGQPLRIVNGGWQHETNS
ncbi:MAG: thiamine-phosphate kinase [Ponticaulis sp.]|nr:thiamine-phosphate kinase [Ponticaulis sp.]